MMVTVKKHQAGKKAVLSMSGLEGLQQCILRRSVNRLRRHGCPTNKNSPKRNQHLITQIRRPRGKAAYQGLIRYRLSHCTPGTTAVSSGQSRISMADVSIKVAVGLRTYLSRSGAEVCTPKRQD